MSKRAFLTVCTMGLALGLVLIYSHVTAQAAVSKSISPSGAMSASAIGAEKKPAAFAKSLLVTTTPTPTLTPTPYSPTYDDSRWSGVSYVHIMGQLRYSVAQFKNDFQALIYVPIVLIALLAIQILRTSILGRFEIEVPIWRRLLKWAIMYGVTIVIALFLPLGLWSLVLPVGWTALDLVTHFSFCRREGIHPIYATPRSKLYELKGWEWPE